jgi:methyl-accepting chemotaxis protein
MFWLGIRAKVVLIAGVASVVSGFAIMAIGLAQSDRFAERASSEAVSEVTARKDGLVLSTVDLIETLDATLQQKLAADVQVGERLAEQLGGFNTSDEELVRWSAINQFDLSTEEVRLPQMRVGETWLGQVSDPADDAVLVDDVLGLVGAISTVFQRMNDDGDMLRVATNVAKNDGTRAIGTYIPATNPDGSPNAVVNTLLSGDTFLGTAFVVNRWYITAYAPIFDERGRVIGSFFVGFPQDAVDELRSAVEGVDVGANGAMSIIRAGGAQRGEYVFSPGGDLDGENVLDEIDADGKPYIEQILDLASGLADGEVGKTIYRSPQHGPVSAHIAYYAPWDWVVVANAVESDFLGVQESLNAGQRDMRNLLLASTAPIVMVIVVVSWLIARRLTAPVQRSNQEVAELATGRDNLPQASAAMARAAATTATESASASHAAESVRANVHQVEQALDSMSSGMDAITGSVRESAASLSEMTASIHDITANTVEVTSVAGQAVEDAAKTSTAVSRLAEASAEVEDVVGLIATITEQTKLLALNATIEAARAGEAGKGFAVVAGEVKDLAEQTAISSDRIATRVQSMMTETGVVTDSIGRIEETINSISELQNTISTALDQQSVAIVEIEGLQQQIARETDQQSQRTRTIADQTAAAREAVDSITTSVENSASSAQATTTAACLVEAASETLIGVATELDRVVSGHH